MRTEQSRKTVLWSVCLLLFLSLLLTVSCSCAASSGSCGENAVWSLDKKGVLTISGTGDLGFASYADSFSVQDIKKIIIEEGIVSIPDGFFSGASNLTEVIIRNGLKKIGSDVFANCRNLKRIVIPASVHSIREWFGCVHHEFYIDCKPGSYAESYAKNCGISFHNKNCPTFGYKIKNLNQKVDWIVSTYIRSGMTDYEKARVLHDWICHNAVYDFSAFSGGNSAANILINGRGVCGCYSLAYGKLLSRVGIANRMVTGMIEFPNDHGWNLVQIGNKWYHVDVTHDDGDNRSYQFFMVTSKQMELYRGWNHSQYPTNDEPLSEIVVDGIAYSLKGNNATVVRVRDTKAWEVIIPDTVVSNATDYLVSAIGPSAFKGMKNLETVFISSAVKTIGKNAFSECKKLHTFTGGSALTSIGDSAFKGCKSLKAVTLGVHLKKIGKSAFSNCSALKAITIVSRKLKSSGIGASAFSRINPSAVITCAQSMLESYRNMLLKKGIPGTVTFIGE